MYNLTLTIKANGKSWLTDQATYDMMDFFRTEGNQYMVGVVFHLACEFGRCKEKT